ncbi:MAG: hypothetical protein CW338_06110 [Clostridiales bacterium]|nr:hypothetical protein [Clostridiales bacterium]
MLLLSMNGKEIRRAGIAGRYRGDIIVKRRYICVSFLLLLAVITALLSVPSGIAEEAEKNNSTAYTFDGSTGFAQISCSTSMLYKGREAVFTVLTDGQQQYTFRFVLSGGDLDENYSGLNENNWSLDVIREETNSTGEFRFTPVLSSGIYRLDVHVTGVNGYDHCITDYYTGGDPEDIDDPSTLTGKVAEIVAECRAMNYDNDYDIALFMHDWLINNADYDYYELENMADGVLLRGKGMCVSYSCAYHILMNEMGIPCYTVNGYGKNLKHAWNMICLDGVWGYVDCTWDDPGEMLPGGEEKTRKYFYVSDSEMAEDHTWKEENYPVCPEKTGICEREGHLFEDREGKAATCREQGWDAYRVCVRCGLSDFTQFIPAKGHTFADHVCIDCGMSDTKTDEGDLCGLHWDLSRSGVLTISGTGDIRMPEGISGYSKKDNKALYPWSSYSAQINRVVISSGITGIGSYAFYELNDVTGVSIPDTVTYIGADAFDGCSGLTEITIPDSVAEIGEGAFAFCSSMRSAVLPSGLKSIPGSAFIFCRQLNCITFPSGLTSIGESAFNSCGFESITIPDGVTAIGGWAFDACSQLQDITLPVSLKEIGRYAFIFTDLYDVYYQGSAADRESINGIGDSMDLLYADWHYNTPVYGDMSMLFLPYYVTDVDAEALAGTGAQIIIIPPFCRRVAEDAFDGCPDLVYIVNRSHAVITAPQGVTVIDESFTDGAGE